MSFTSVLATIGKDVAKVFEWIGSPQGKAIITTAEGVVEAIYPPAAGLINLANLGLTEAIKMEALAAGAAKQSGTGAQKLVGVIGVLTPQILAYAKQNGWAPPNAAQIENAANALVAFANAFDAAPAPAPTSQP